MLKPAEVAALLQCSTANVYALIDVGDLPAVRTGARGKGYRVDEDDLQNFIARRKTQGPNSTQGEKLTADGLSSDKDEH